jgi:hypothetical protein
MTSKFDRASYYYTFEYYLYEQELDYTVLNYLDNNNINLRKLVCFFDIIKNDTHYIITTNEENLHKVISITKCEHIDNFIYGNLVVSYNGYKFTVYDNMSLAEAEKLIAIENCDIVNYDNYYYNDWSFRKINDCEIRISIINKRSDFIWLNNFRILSILTGCIRVHIDTLKHYQKVDIYKFDVSKLFPNTLHIMHRGETVYKR